MQYCNHKCEYLLLEKGVSFKTIKYTNNKLKSRTKMNKPPKKLLDQVRELIRLKHYSIRTEQAYVSWIKRFILFHEKKHPNDMGKTEVEEFLSHLATNLNVASSTQNQAFNPQISQITQITMNTRLRLRNLSG